MLQSDNKVIVMPGIEERALRLATAKAAGPITTPVSRQNVVPFPVNMQLAEATRAYRDELVRFDRLLCEGKRARFSKNIREDYFATRREARGWKLGA
jgi:hypothetical protein